MNITVQARSVEINKVVKFRGGPIDIGGTLVSLKINGGCVTLVQRRGAKVKKEI